MMSYKKLFKLLIDREMKESEFRKLVGISAPTLSKLRNGETITTEILCRICDALDVQPEDIMRYVKQ